jgi:hypothetical protein
MDLIYLPEAVCARAAWIELEHYRPQGVKRGEAARAVGGGSVLAVQFRFLFAKRAKIFLIFID